MPKAPHGVEGKAPAPIRTIMKKLKSIIHALSHLFHLNKGRPFEVDVPTMNAVMTGWECSTCHVVDGFFAKYYA
jgi:hypothetical protein